MAGGRARGITGAHLKLIAVRDGQEITVQVERTGGGYVVTVGERTMEVSLVSANEFAKTLTFADGSQFLLGHRRDGDRHEISFGNDIVHVELRDPLALRRQRRDDAGGSGRLKAIMPGRIVRVLVKTGDEVTRGSGLLVLEAMKMENEIMAPCDGTVSEVFVADGETVESGAPLVTIE
jgi:biotin carboxyl carrier protein